MSVEVRQAGPADRAAWDAFVHAQGEVFHLWGWGAAVGEALRQSPLNLIAEADGEIVGVLPLTDKRSGLFGDALIGNGFAVGAGIAASSPEAAEALAEAAQREGLRRRSAYVELRGGPLPDGWVVKDDAYASFSREIEADEDLRLKAIPRKKRADIRKAIDAAGAGRLSASTTDDVTGFWSRYARAQRDHGTPVLPRRLLEALRQELGEIVEIAEVHGENGPLAGVFSLYHGGIVHLYHAYVGEAARGTHAGDYLYWWMMGQGLSRGARLWDLGRSKPGTGSYAYKTFWGLTPEPLRYGYRLLTASEVPNVNPQNPKFRLLTEGWRRLPLSVADRLGPVLYRHLG